eukprot:57665-Prymnesium_polylepis.2
MQKLEVQPETRVALTIQAHNVRTRICLQPQYKEERKGNDKGRYKLLEARQAELGDGQVTQHRLYSTIRRQPVTTLAEWPLLGEGPAQAPRERWRGLCPVHPRGCAWR